MQRQCAHSYFHFLNHAKLINPDGSIINETELSGGVLSRLKITPISFQSQGWDKRRSETVPEVKVGVNELYLAYDFSFF